MNNVDSAESYQAGEMTTCVRTTLTAAALLTNTAAAAAISGRHFSLLVQVSQVSL